MNKRSLRIFLAAVVTVLTLTMAACSNSSNSGASGSAGNGKSADKITITGLLDKDIEITADELKSMENVTKEVSGLDSDGDTVNYKAKGVLLDQILKKYDRSQKDLKGIRLVAGDGYSIEVPEDVLKNRDIILAFELNGKELDSNSQPVRAMIPDERAMYWVKNLAKIEVLKEAEKKDISRVIFLDSADNAVNASDIDFYGQPDKAIRTGDLLNKFNSGADADILFIKAADKLSKNETKDNFLKGYIKITGENIPAFVSNDLPVGMHVKNLLWFSCGEDSYFSVKNGIAALNKTAMDGKDGVLLSDIVKEIGLAGADKYVLEGVDGYTAEIESKDLAGGLVYISDNGDASVYFKDLPKGTNIKGLLSVTVKK